MEFIPTDSGQQMKNLAIMSPDEKYQGLVEVLFVDRKPSSIYDIETENKGFGYGTKAVRALLESSDSGKLDISNFVPEAQGLWEKLGIPKQNLEEGAAYDDTITRQSLEDSAFGKKSREKNSDSQGQAGIDSSKVGGTISQGKASSEIGPFGPVSTKFHHDSQGAIAHLMETKDGEAIGALHHPDVGDIDLVWGDSGKNENDGYGLAKLVRWHPEVLNDLQNIVASMQVTKRSENCVQLESADHRGAVRLQWDGVSKHWLLTAFEKDKGDGTKPSTDMLGAEGRDGSPADTPRVL